MYAKRYTNGSRSGLSEPQTKKILFWILFVLCLAIFSIVVGILFPSPPDKGSLLLAYAGTTKSSGFGDSSGIGNSKRLIDFSLKINGLAASRAGTLSGTTENQQPPIIFGGSQINKSKDSGNKNQDNQFNLSSIRTALKRAIGTAGSTERPIHSGGTEQQLAIDYAWEISHDKTFIYLLKAENGNIAIGTKSKLIGNNGYRDYGFCQVNKGFHPEIVNNPKFLTDYKWQLDQCYRLYKSGTTFYGLIRLKSDKIFAKRIKGAFKWTT